MKLSVIIANRKVLFFLCLVLLLFVVGAALFYSVYLPKRYGASVTMYAEEFGVDKDLAYAVIRTESNFREDAVSSAGARGLMQLMPSTAQFIAGRVGEDLSVDDPNDNIRMGIWYLAYLQKKFSGQTEVLAAYNAGEGAVRRWLKDGSCSSDGVTLQDIPLSETRQYVKRVKKFYNCYKFFY